MTPECINAHGLVYSYLLSYFLPDLSDSYFRQDAAQEIEQDERMTYCRYMAAWLPHESHYDQILDRYRYLNDKQHHLKRVVLFVIACLDNYRIIGRDD